MELYEAAIQEAIAKAANGFIVTFGVVPTKPETGHEHRTQKRWRRFLQRKTKPNDGQRIYS